MEKDVTEKIFDLIKNYTEDEINEIIEEVKALYLDSITVLEPEEVHRQQIEFIETTEEIFNLCPKCNCIPIAIEYTDGNSYITDTDFETVYDYCVDYINEEIGEYVMPFFDDDMTLGQWKELRKKWKWLNRNSGIKYDVDKSDYYAECKYFYLCVYVFDKASKTIKFITNFSR